MNHTLRALCILSLLVAWGSPARALVISEVMYNPETGGVEFIEIYNEDAESRDLSHYYFSRGIHYLFPGFEDQGSVFIRGKSYLVVTPDVQKMLQLYPHLENSDPLFPAVIGPETEDAVKAFGFLDNGGETVSLANPGGAVDAEVKYNNRGGWPSAADGTGHSLVLQNPELDDPEDNDSWTWSPLRGGSPGLANFGETVYTDTPILGPSETWKLFRGRTEASDPREAWRQPGFDDAAWEQAVTPIGFKDPCYNGTVLDDMVNNYLSIYLRRTFEVPDLSQVDSLVLRMSFDDGFIAYLNGKEVARKNLTADAFDSRAGGSSECTVKTDFVVADLAGKLVQGTNLLCFQVHNTIVSNDDFGVIPELLSRKGRNVGGASRIDVDLNELFWNTSEPNGAWLELYNDQDVEQDLSGLFLTDDPAQPRKYVFPAGTRIPARAFLVVEQSQLNASGILLNVLNQSTDKTKFIALSRLLPDQPPERALQVVDAYRFRILTPGAPAGISDGRYPDGKEDWVVCRQATKGAANKLTIERSVVLNEIMFHSFYPFDNDFVPGTDGFFKPEDQGEYIELFNRGDAAVDLSGWSFTKGVEYQFPGGTSIGPGAYLVVARDPNYIRSLYNLPQGQVYGPWFKSDTDDEGNPVVESAVLADGGEKVELSDELGNPVDGVRYADNHRWSPWTDSRGSSIERVDPNQDGSRASNWDASDESLKSEWKHYTFTGRYTEAEKELQIMLLTRGIVLIDNLKVTDPANAASPNYIANGDFELALGANWLIDGTHISSGRISYDKKDGEACLKIISTGRGNNRLDRIKYANPLFPVNKNLVLEFDAKWICGEGTLLFTGTWNTFAHRFYLEPPRQAGSPGKENSVRARLPGKNQGPLVERVRQTPVLPAGGQPVVLTAQVTDSDGVRDVAFSYSLDSVRTAATTLPMLDDGQPPDVTAGDGIYTVTVPGQVLGKRVVFSILAADTLGNTWRFPYDDRQRTHPYLLNPLTEDPTKLRYAVYIHGALTNTSGGVPEYRLLMHQENLTYLTTRRVMNNDIVDSSLVWNDSKIWYNIGVRYGNSPWTRPGGKSYVVKLPREDMLQGYKKFKLDNRGSEINERVVYYLIRSNNVPGREFAPYGRSTYTRPVLNGTPSGVFERVEMPSKPFVSRWWPNDSNGVLYKLDDKFLVNADGSRRDNRDAFIQYPPDRSGNGDDPEEYRWYFMHRTREKYDDFSELSELAKFFTSSQTPAATYDAQLFERVNVESLIRTLSISINVDDWDTWGTTRGKNSFIYHPQIDGRWTLIGWDKDLTLGNPSSLPLVPGMFPEVSRLLNSTGGKRVYYSILDSMLTRFFQASYLNLFFNQHAKDKGGKLISGLPSSAAGAANFLTTRTNVIRSALPRNPAFDLITGGAEGAVVAAQSSLNIEGNAPLTVWQMVITNPAHPNWLDPQGRVKELVLEVSSGAFTWTTPTRWKTILAIPVVDGINDLTFQAFSAEGELLGSDTLKVIYNVNWSAPAVASVNPARGPSAGGYDAVVTGSDFHVGAKVFFGTAAAQVKALDETAGTLTVKVPAGVMGQVDVKVQNLDGKSGVLAGGFTYGGARFNRGDVDHSGLIDLSDAINILNYQFFAGTLTCLAAADVNDDDVINVTDPIMLLTYQYSAGDPPAAPFDPDGVLAGEDPTAGELGCQQGR